MSARMAPWPLRIALQELGELRELAEEIEGLPREQSAVLRNRLGRMRELVDAMEQRLDEVAALASDGLLDNDYRTIATCSDCGELAGHARSAIDNRPLCDECQRWEARGAASQ